MISIIIPVYNEEDNLPVLQEEIVNALKMIGPYEIIYVDDGSVDHSLSVLRKIRTDSSNVRVIEFTRHFGQTEAMQAGIDHASGEVLVFLDADLQNDPKDIPSLLAKLEEGFDVVSGWRKSRQDPFLIRKIPSYLANLLISKITGIKLHDVGCTLKAYRKVVFERFRLYSEMHRLMVIYVARQGGLVAEIAVSHRKRIAGKSKYGLSRVFRLILDFFVAEFMNNYLNKPMYIFGGCGISLIFLSFCVGLIIIIRKVFYDGIWVSPLLFLFVMFSIIGLQLILMGLIAEITMRIYYEKKKTYFIRNIL